MLLAAAGEQEFLGLRVAVEAQGLVFLEDALDGVPHAVLVLPRLGLDGIGDGWLGQLHGRVFHQGGLIAQRVAGQRLLELRHGADVAGVQLGDGLEGLAHQARDVGEPLAAARARVHQVGVVLQHAGVHLEIGDASGERIGNGFENERRNRLGIGDLARHFLLAAFPGNLAPGGRRRQVVGDEVQQQVGADVVQRTRREHREEALVHDGLAQAAGHLLGGERAFVEELLEQRVVAFGDHLDERIVRLLSRLGHGRGDFFFLSLAVAVGGVRVSLHGQQVHHAAEVALAAYGQLDGHRGPPEVGVNALQGALETGPLAVQLVDDHRPRKPKRVAEPPHLLGLDFDARHAVHHHQRGIGGHQRGAGVVDEDIEAGRVEQVDFGLVPLGGGDRGRDGHLALDLFVVEIRDGGALVDARQAVGGARGEEDGGGQRGLSAVAVADQTYVPNVLALVDFHSE